MQRVYAEAIPEPRLGRGFLECGLCPWLNSFLAKIFQRGHNFLVTDSHLAFCQRCSVCSFHLPGYLVICLLCGFSNRLSVPHEFVPVDIATFVNGHLLLSFLLPLMVFYPLVNFSNHAIEIEQVKTRTLYPVQHLLD